MLSKKELNTIQDVYAYQFEGKRYDVGEQLGFIETTLAFALERPDLRDGVLDLMETFLKQSTEIGKL